MVYSKKFLKDSADGSQHWQEILLSEHEERECEQRARKENLYLVRKCIADARNVVKDERLMDMQSHVLSIALALFKKRASHCAYYKEEECAKKFRKYWDQPKKDMKRREGAKSSSPSS